MMTANEALEFPGSSLSITRIPAEVLEEARGAAQALQKIIAQKHRPVVFNGEQYLEFEDWQTVARFYGVTARVRETRLYEKEHIRGYEASADAILISSGICISAAEAMCLSDEPNWSKKPLFQLRSMAQTRACAKAFGNLFSWVVVLAGYRPTPAEEMTGNETNESKPSGPRMPERKSDKTPKPAPSPGPTPEPPIPTPKPAAVHDQE